jgi:hypothetical protein
MMPACLRACVRACLPACVRSVASRQPPAAMASPRPYRWEASLKVCLDSVEARGEFMYQVDQNVDGSESTLPSLTVEGVGSFSLPLRPQDAAPLVAAASAAPFGHVTAASATRTAASATRTDAAVRRALQIDQARVSFSADFPETLRDITAGDSGRCAMRCHPRCVCSARHAGFQTPPP